MTTYYASIITGPCSSRTEEQCFFPSVTVDSEKTGVVIGQGGAGLKKVDQALAKIEKDLSRFQPGDVIRVGDRHCQSVREAIEVLTESFSEQ